MAKRILLAFALALSVTGPLRGADAMQFRAVASGDNHVDIFAEGRIERGDTRRLLDYILSHPEWRAIDAFLLNSRGGSLVEAEALAARLRFWSSQVWVQKDAVCLSACFLLFAAVSQKTVETGALIGVHSARAGDRETAEAAFGTVLFGRDLADYGVPASIIGRIVMTEPHRISFLSDSELRDMGVAIVPPLPGGFVPTRAPPCKSGAGECSPWERDWRTAPSIGTVLDSLGRMTPPDQTP